MSNTAPEPTYPEQTYTAQQLVALVQERLAPYQPAEAALEVLPDAVHNGGHWWYVVAPPSRSMKNLSDYNRRIDKTERDLYKMDRLRVSILPVVPEWMDTHK